MGNINEASWSDVALFKIDSSFECLIQLGFRSVMFMERIVVIILVLSIISSVHFRNVIEKFS